MKLKPLMALVLIVLFVSAPLTCSAEISQNNIIDEKTGSGFTGETINLPVTGYTVGEGLEILEELDEKKQVLKTGEAGFAQWDFEVTKSGLYAIKVSYRPLEDTKNAIQRGLRLDGALPSVAFASVEFSRVYKDAQKLDSEIKGDMVRPAGEEILRWNTTYLKPSDSKDGDAYYFELSEGKHTLRLDSVQEVMALSELSLESVNRMPESYDKILDIKAGSPSKGLLQDGILIHQAENMLEKSDPTLYALPDISSSANQPYHHVYRKLNTVGGSRWKNIGQWISWEIDIPATGFYNIGFRFRQNSGRQSVRRLTIDGELPFEEAAVLSFQSSDDWQVSSAGGDKPYLFHLQKGRREIKLEVVLGQLSESAALASEVLEKLSGASWSLMTVLGSTPDTNRDYRLQDSMPEVLKTLKECEASLNAIAQTWLKISGERDARIAEIEQLAQQLKYMTDNPDKIPARYSFFRDSVSSFGNLIVTAKEQPLLLDYIFIKEQDTKSPKANASFFEALKNGILRFISTFTHDYDQLSDASEENREIKVWIGNGLTGGRDQAQVLSQMIKQQFTPEKKIGVQLQLVPPGTILTATLANKGPDAALQIGGSEPVNYAMRSAVIDLSRFSDFQQTVSVFPKELLVGYTYQGGIYAVPETMSFPMFFYRKDILAKLGIDPASLKTWDEVMKVLPDIQASNMNVAMPAIYTSYYLFLYQNGGALYADGGRKTALDEKAALDAFNTYTRLYTSYGLPFTYNFETRFRTGEIPLGIADFSTYNLLKLSAPEIDGLWEMTTIPGTEKNGVINASVPVSGAGAIIMSSAKDPEAAWEFVRWWVSADNQYSFGMELESVMGTGARYNTANPQALSRLPWTSRDRKQILAQIENLKGIPEVPGGYITQRNVEFALKTTNNENSDARANLLSYIKSINDEISSKRKEFRLD